MADVPDLLGFNPPAFSVDQILSHLQSNYGLGGELTALEGEREQNFRMQCGNDENLLIRISNHDEKESVLDFQTKALIHLSTSNLAGKLPIVHHDKSKNYMTRLGENQHLFRVLSYLPGEPLAAANVDSIELARNCGHTLGSVTDLLSSFSHPAQDSFMAWDMTNGLLQQDFLWHQAANDLRDIEKRYRQTISSSVLPQLAVLRRQNVHNDAHQENWLRRDKNAQLPCALIDFGDLINTHIACDLAILCLGFAENSANPEQSIASAIEGYHQAMPLLKEEIDLVYDLMLTRQIFTLLLFDYKIHNNASASPAVRIARPEIYRNLFKLEQIDQFKLRDTIFDLCRL